MRSPILYNLLSFDDKVYYLFCCISSCIFDVLLQLDCPVLLPGLLLLSVVNFHAPVQYCIHDVCRSNGIVGRFRIDVRAEVYSTTFGRRKEVCIYKGERTGIEQWGNLCSRFWKTHTDGTTWATLGWSLRYRSFRSLSEFISTVDYKKASYVNWLSLSLQFLWISSFKFRVICNSSSNTWVWGK